jgi:hypothetical protein
MRWRCIWVHHRLALFVGDDLSSSETQQVTNHLEVCAACRRKEMSLRQSHDALLLLRVTNSEPRETSMPSLWPALQNAVTSLQAKPAPERSWLPISAVLAASVAIAIVLWNRPTSPPSAVLPSVRPYPAISRDVTAASLPGSSSEVPRFDEFDELEPGVFPDTYYHLPKARPVSLSVYDF